MQGNIKLFAIGAIPVLAITVLGIIFLFNAGFPVIDPGITENNFTIMIVERKATLPSPSDPFLNVSESQINRCMILKTACQDLIENDQDLIEIKINGSELTCITSFLESLSPQGAGTSLIYYQGFYFEIAFLVG
ncbi:MAG: hypothetical protein ACFFFG_15870 [Candidatus Thorarchaeota archaeon]